MRLLLATLLLRPPSEPPVQTPEPAIALALEWSGPESCPSREQLVDAIRAYLPDLAEPPLEAGHARLRARAHVEARDDGFAVELELVGLGTQMQRSFGDRDCVALAEGVALIIAVTLEPIAISSALGGSAATPEPEPIREPEPEPDPELEPETEPEPEPEREPRIRTLVADDPRPATSARVRPRVGLRLVGGGGYGPTQTGYGSLAAALALFEDRWRAQIDGGGFLPRDRALDDGRAARIGGWWLGARGCYVPARNVLEYPVCVGFEGGQVIGQGLPPTQNPNTDSFPWLAAAITPGLSWAPLRRLALGVEASLLLPFGRGAFEIDGQVLDSLTPVGVRASAFVELRL